MPRSARIDVGGLLQHVMVRGIEKRDIFLDDRDRVAFLNRLSNLLVKTQTDCLAWALLSNHVHLLLRPSKDKLAVLMRRLLTGYAVVFNLRHKRTGHLFQNRYKSIVCEEESYLLELVRYIHLNPVRAGMVRSMDELDVFKWSGHTVIMGHFSLPGQVPQEVLNLFKGWGPSAVTRYREFVSDGIALGKRDELAGGGLKRYLRFSGSRDFEAYDERILGSGAFVEVVWHETEEKHPVSPPPPIAEIVKRVAEVFGVDLSDLLNGRKERYVSEARGVVCFIAINKYGYHGVDVSQVLRLSQSGVVLAARRGKASLDAHPFLINVVTEEVTQ